MQLVIEIDNTDYRLITEKMPSELSGEFIETIFKKIENGIPLPKGHGELKDVDAIHEEIDRLQSGIGKNGGAVIINRDQYKGLCYARGIINEAPVIIEADGGEADDQ